MHCKQYAIILALIFFVVPQAFAQKCSAEGSILSSKGGWISWVAEYPAGDSLYIKNSATGRLHTFPYTIMENGKRRIPPRPVFSDDENWVAYSTVHSRGMAYLNLRTGIKKEIEGGAAPVFGGNDKFLAFLVEQEETYSLKIVGLYGKQTYDFRNVDTDWLFNKAGTTLVFVQEDTMLAGKSIYLLNPATGYKQLLKNVKEGNIKSYAWCNNDNEIIFLIDNKTKNKTWLCRFNLKSKKLQESEISIPGIPAGREIDGNRVSLSYQMSKTINADYVFFSLTFDTIQEAKNRLSGDIGSKDLAIRKSLGTYVPIKGTRGFYNIEHRSSSFVESELGYPFQLSKNYNYALVSDLSQYEGILSDRYADYTLVNIKTGDKQLFLKKFALTDINKKAEISISPNERFILYYLNKHWWSFGLVTGLHTCLTKNMSVSFEDNEYDKPGIKPSYGYAGWSVDGNSVYVYDKLDVYAINVLDLSVKKLTAGSKRKIKFRIMFPGVSESNEERYVNVNDPIFLSAEGIENWFNGYYLLHNNRLQELVYENARLTKPVKAVKAQVYAYLREKIDEMPGLCIITPGKTRPLAVWKQVCAASDSCPAKSEIINYYSRNGRYLSGALFYPAGYRSGKKYPVIVKIYERQSKSVNKFVPRDAHNNNFLSRYTEQGYFIFCPDIFFEVNNPGFSAVDCVVSAVEKLLSTGLVDPEKIGLMGGSWGGYLTTFIITQTNLFKAAIASCPITDLVSMSLTDRATNPLFYFEGHQGRMGGPFYSETNAYINNSPIYHVQKINTPLLLIHGDDDGQVDWHQSMQMEYAMRRAQKPCIFLLYKGENHGITKKKENKEDCYKKRMEYFGHHLKGADAAAWMKN